METPQDHDHQLLAAGGSSAALIRNKVAIFDEYKRRLRERVPSIRAEPGPIIINTLPSFLTRLALALAPDSELDFASDYSNIALAHGNERAKLTNYSLADVIHEYQILREILVDTLKQSTVLTDKEWHIVHRSIDEAIADAASAYVQVQQEFRDLFTAALSHDFRGPLSNAVNYVELIRRDAEPGQHGHFASRALFNLKRVDRMIQDLLDATRANAGAQMTLKIQRADVGALARDVIGDLILRVGDRFKLEVTDQIQGWWDEERLKQALLNLLENAVKYGDEGPITCRISAVQGRMFMSIHNTGNPIPAELIPVLFQPFRRSVAAGTRPKSGWGLGLVMVQAIAQAHGGSVTVESSPSDGTTFTMDVLCDARKKAAEIEAAGR
jgi:signal transduction histidine kinase